MKFIKGHEYDLLDMTVTWKGILIGHVEGKDLLVFRKKEGTHRYVVAKPVGIFNVMENGIGVEVSIDLACVSFSNNLKELWVCNQKPKPYKVTKWRL